MKFKAKTKEMLSAAKFVAQAAKSKTTLPVLSHTLIQVESGKMRMHGTNLDLFMSSHFACESSDTSAFCVPSALLSSFLGSVDSEAVEGKLDGSMLMLEAGNTKAKISTLAAEEFPARPDHDFTQTIELPESDLHLILSRVAPAMHRDASNSRPNLAGACFRLGGGHLKVLATEGHMISENTRDYAGKGEWLVPIMVIDAALRSASASSDEPCSILLSEKSARIVSGQWEIQGPLVDAKFIAKGATDGYFAVEKKSSVAVNREQFLRSIRKLDPFHNVTNKFITIKFDGQKVKISTGGAEHSGSDEIDATGGSAFEFCINPDYLSAMVSAGSGEEVTIRFIDSLSPIIIEETGFRCAIMCMRGN